MVASMFLAARKLFAAFPTLTMEIDKYEGMSIAEVHVS